jgi:excisionase family DNA binding protein
MKARSLLSPSRQSYDAVAGEPALTTAQAARLIGCTPRYVARLVDSGRLIGYRLPYSSHRRISAASLEDFMQHHGIRRRRDSSARIADISNEAKLT